MSATTSLADRDSMPMFLKWGMAFLAFYTVNQLHFPQSLGVPGLNILNLICLIVWIAHLRTGRRNDIKPVMRKRFFVLFAMIFYSFLIAQVTLPDDLMSDLNYLKASIFYPIFFFIYFYVVRTEDDIRFIIYACLAIAIIAGLECVREGLAFGTTTFHPMKRASGPFGDDAFTANRAGIFLTMLFCLALAVALYQPEPGNRWIRAAAMAGMFFVLAGLFYTFSRQSYLIVGVVAALMMLRRGPALIVILLIAAVSYQSWVPDAAVDRLTDTKQVDEDGKEQVDDSTSSRWVQWEAGWRMIQDKPWGIGFRRFEELSGSYGGKPDLDAHNHYVLFATEASLIGLAVHLILVLSLWWYGHSYYRLAKRRRNPLGRCLGSAMAFMTIAMILGNVYGSPFSNGEVMGLYWILAGLMARHMLILKADLRLARLEADPAAPSETAPLGKSADKQRPRRLGRRHGRPVPPKASPPSVTGSA